ncbi:MAG TPA: hypothetical protein VIY48_05415 [Candidatus Paceibacterota bacterium]|jgi:hypothetical protein
MNESEFHRPTSGQTILPGLDKPERSQEHKDPQRPFDEYSQSDIGLAMQHAAWHHAAQNPVVVLACETCLHVCSGCIAQDSDMTKHKPIYATLTVGESKPKFVKLEKLAKTAASNE